MFSPDPVVASEARKALTSMPGLLARGLRGTFKGDIDIDVDIEVDVQISLFFCLKGASKSVQVLLNGIEAAMILALIILK